MTTTLWIVVFVVIVLVIAAGNWWLGMWSNFITFVNLLLSAMVATSYYQNLANAAILGDSSWIHVIDFTMVWALFVGTYVVLRGLTEFLSRYQMRFHPIVEMAGRTIGSLAVALVFVAFVSFTLLFAPCRPSDSMAFNDRGFYPEATWVGLIDHLSQNALSSPAESPWFGNAPANGFRPMGSVDLYQQMGDSLRKSVDESTSLRIIKARF